MKIVKYIRLKDGKYKILFDNNEYLTTYESVITKHNLLCKSELGQDEYQGILNDNTYYDIYIKVVKYINIRLRSKKEIEMYLKRLKIDDNITKKIIDNLRHDKYIDDERFSLAYIKDKYNFTSNGPYKIINELVNLGIDKDKAMEYTFNIITSEEEKITKLINKYLKLDKKHDWYYVKNKIYNNLIKLGYSKDTVISILNNYN